MEPFNLALTPARKGACVVELWCKWWNGDTSTEGEMIFLEEEPLHGRAYGLRGRPRGGSLFRAKGRRPCTRVPTGLRSFCVTSCLLQKSPFLCCPIFSMWKEF
ncbi:hypothetical protein KC19_4G250100 [Ceratodon purpureus]|uniref:Uncharacterized protein n=1 Tax=Ceratodon purpureus TaxID=3225 RepID=A0A8T0IDD3_CERPU|nr:hypothetical protein KC19_4G250100 [Ceratodon purpureus]